MVGGNLIHYDINNNKELVLGLGLKIDSHHRIHMDYGTSHSLSSIWTIFLYNLVNHINSLVLQKADVDKGGLKVVSFGAILSTNTKYFEYVVLLMWFWLSIRAWPHPTFFVFLNMLRNLYFKESCLHLLNAQNLCASPCWNVIHQAPYSRYQFLVCII